MHSLVVSRLHLTKSYPGNGKSPASASLLKSRQGGFTWNTPKLDCEVAVFHIFMTMKQVKPCFTNYQPRMQKIEGLTYNSNRKIINFHMFPTKMVTIFVYLALKLMEFNEECPFQVLFDFASEPLFCVRIDLMSTKWPYVNEMTILCPKSGWIRWHKLHFVDITSIRSHNLCQRKSHHFVHKRD